MYFLEIEIHFFKIKLNITFLIIGVVANCKGVPYARRVAQTCLLHASGHVASCQHTWRLRIYYLLIAWPRQLPANCQSFSEKAIVQKDKALTLFPPSLPLSLSLRLSACSFLPLLFSFCPICARVRATGRAPCILHDWLRFDAHWKLLFCARKAFFS